MKLSSWKSHYYILLLSLVAAIRCCSHENLNSWRCANKTFVWGFPKMEVPLKPLVSILQWSFMTWVIWGYPHDLGNIHLLYWMVVWNMFIFPYIGFPIIPTDELIFFRGVETNQCKSTKMMVMFRQGSDANSQRQRLHSCHQKWVKVDEKRPKQGFWPKEMVI